MNKRPENRLVPAFEQDIGFDILPFAGSVQTAHAADPVNAEFALLQEKLLENAFSHTETLSLYGAIRQAANEAAGLAWTTEFPLLVYPSLFDEKTLAFRKREHRQQQIMARSHALLEEARA
jgi:hypothetical protein